jgi:hypothetical protein
MNIPSYKNDPELYKEFLKSRIKAAKYKKNRFRIQNFNTWYPTMVNRIIENRFQLEDIKGE